jgi:hypothetical protein
MLLAVRINLNDFVRDLQEGDLFVWGIVVGVVFFSSLSAWQKLRGQSAEWTSQADHEA